MRCRVSILRLRSTQRRDCSADDAVLESEILMTLRLLGANKLSDLRPSMVEVKE